MERDITKEQVKDLTDEEFDRYYEYESPYGDQKWSDKFRELHKELVRREKITTSKFYIENL
jgi:hypothetical protein